MAKSEEIKFKKIILGLGLANRLFKYQNRGDKWGKIKFYLASSNNLNVSV